MRKIFSALVLMILLTVLLLFALRPGLRQSSTVKYLKSDIRHALKEFHSADIKFDTLLPGDMVVRTGRSFFSNQLRKFSQKEDTYSHCGLIGKDEHGQTVIYHAIGGTDNPDSRVRCDTLFTFCNPVEASRFAVFRYDIDHAERMAVDSLAHHLFQQRVKFDLAFDLTEDSTLYCSEFIYHVLCKATSLKKFLSLSHLNGKDYVGVDDLYLNNRCKKIFEHEYH